MKGLSKLSASAVALFLAASFISFSWSAPQAPFQRRNWTPQAMLYLKGAQGRRFIPDESQRKDLYDRMQLETRSQNTNPLSLSEAAALFLSSLRKAQEGGQGGREGGRKLPLLLAVLVASSLFKLLISIVMTGRKSALLELGNVK